MERDIIQTPWAKQNGGYVLNDPLRERVAMLETTVKTLIDLVQALVNDSDARAQIAQLPPSTVVEKARRFLTKMGVKTT